MKANINTKEGTKIIIEGTEEEVARVVNIFKETSIKEKDVQEDKKFTKSSVSRLSVSDLVLTLQAEGYFDKPRTLAQIKTNLEEQGHFYPITTLSGIVLLLVKKRNLRRVRTNKVWEYVRSSK